MLHLMLPLTASSRMWLTTCARTPTLLRKFGSLKFPWWLLASGRPGIYMWPVESNYVDWHLLCGGHLFFCGVICFYIQETNSGYQFSIYVARVCMTSIRPRRGGRESLGKSAWSGLGWCFGESQRSSLSPLSQLALAAIVLRVWMLSHCGISCTGWTHLGSKLLASIWVFGKYHTAVETCLTLT